MALLRMMAKTLKIDEKVEAGCTVLHVAAATAVNAVGDVIDHIHQKYTDSECLVDIGAESSSSDSDRDDNEVEVEGVDIEGPHKKLADIEPFLKMAMYAYKDRDMDKKFPFVTNSKLVKDVKHPTLLFPERDITTDTEVHVCVLEDGSLAFAFRGTECRLQDLQSLLGDVMTDLLKAQVPVELYNGCDDVAYRGAPSIRAHQGFQIAFRDVTKTARPAKCGGRHRSLYIPNFYDHHCKSYRQSVKKALAAFSHHRPHRISLPPFCH
ncbi:hypothetical protein GOP47_0029271 [Adiantum capillus-veneris]|nr:hypothetical protein GOP47_0029271 [Adiantum capillus-veneris]